MRANVYVDGFNLYFGALQHTPYKWLDLRKLSAGLLRPGVELGRIRYFTARVGDRESRPGSPARQNAYLAAISTLPEVEIEFGLFRAHPRSMPLADGSGLATVIRTEEKGSDVNLATRLLLDAFANDCDVALVISNDSDLVLPIRETRRLGVTVGISAPVYHRSRHPHQELAAAADFNVHITRKRAKLLRASQFPQVLMLEDGRRITKPREWD